jgi:hypothetical protein
VFRFVFDQLLGLDCERRESFSGNKVEVRLAAAPEQGCISWQDVFFQTPRARWLSVDSLPRSPLPRWQAERDLPDAPLTQPVIPVIYGRQIEGKDWFLSKGNDIEVGIDIAGSVFFMLTRYEEAVLGARDRHKRFPAQASLAYSECFMERPIADEYVEILWTCMKRIWHGLKRKERQYRVFLSHDVDLPLGAVNQPWFAVVKSGTGDVLKRKDVRLGLRRLLARVKRNPEIDPHNTFEFILDTSERYGLKSTFFFKSGSSHHKYDVDYYLDDAWVRRLVRTLYDRGHEIGLHPSYDTYNTYERLRLECNTFRQVMDELGIVQSQWGARQHYLRWENPVTWQIYEDLGLDYDATLGFADHVGFRCGTCHDFPAFNLKARRKLRLNERPLVVMDTTLLSEHYMAMEPDEACEKVIHLSEICRHCNGTFSLLWHNTTLLETWQRELYLSIVRAAT